MHIICYFQVANYTNATPYCAVSSNDSTARDCRLTRHCGVLTDNYVMGYMNLIVENYAIADNRVVQSTTIYRAICADICSVANAYTA